MMIGLAAILLLGIGAQWLAWRLRLPSILLLLFTGIVAGPVLGWVDPDVILKDLLLPAVSLSVGLVLFEGGLGLRAAELSGVGAVVRNLVTVGALLTWAVASLAAHYIVGMEWRLAILLGAVLVVTGPTVIGPLLRHVRPTGRVGPILKWEGTVIDPIGALLAVLVFHAIEAGNLRGAASGVAIEVLRTLSIGCSIGLLSSVVLVFVLRRFWVPDYLQNPVSLAFVIGAFVASNQLQADSGLFTVVVMGIVLANQRDVQIRHLVEFKENLSVLLVSSLFIVLAARLRWEHVAQLRWQSGAFLVVLIVVGRPLAVWVSALRSGLTWRERVFLAWMAPRGIVAAAVSSVFALRLREQHIENADLMVSLTFMVIIGSVLVYALSARLVAQRLGLARRGAAGFLIAGATPLGRAIAKALMREGIDVLLVDTNKYNIRRARDEGLSTYLASVLSDRVFQRIELSPIGRLLALTPSDEVNALAAMQYSRAFGRSEVYQLAPAGQPGGRGESVASDLRGRVLFQPALPWSTLDDRLADGARATAIRLTETFDLAAFRVRFGDKAVALFALDDVGGISPITADASITPKPGHTLLCLLDADAPAPPGDDPASDAAARELQATGAVETVPA